MSIHLFKHNQEAYNSVTAMLEREKMAAVIHPTGTGKSLIAFKLAEEHPSEKFLWLSPSEYIYQTQLENLGMEFDNIQFMSYSRLMKNEDSIETLHPDYIILDEFHRCGAAEWGKSVRKLLTACPDAKRLGLSATNIRYLDNQRNMAEEIFDGKIASEMTLGEAIVRGILPEPKYVIAMYSYKKELDQLKKRVQALSNQGLITENQKLLEQLRRALEQAEGLDKALTKEQQEQLAALGMIWDRNTEKWEEYFEAAQEYYRQHGNLEVMAKYVTEEGLPLGRWLSDISNKVSDENLRRVSLTDEQLERLKSIGFKQEKKTARQWNEKYELAKNYYEIHGDLNVPLSYCVNDVKLGRWISNIRSKRKHPESNGMALSQDRIRQLDNIGMNWK